jgi:transcription elongation factor GreB
MSQLNYITPTGLQKLKDELQYLMKEDRPQVVKTVAWAASNGDRSENADYIYGKKRLREIDRRMAWLTKRIEAAEVVDPKTLNNDKVVFGATVTIEDEEGVQKTYQIVGEDEIDTGSGKISWKSPIAKALLNKKQGDEVKIRRPKGDNWVEIVKLEYR